MELRYSPDSIRFSTMTTQEIRENFLIETLFKPSVFEMIYSDIDRVIVGSAVPVNQTLSLTSADELRAEYFCQRRELGVLNIGQNGIVKVDSRQFDLANRDCLYIGRGSKEVNFSSQDASNPAQFYLMSYPAHKEYPTTLIKTEQANQVHLGSIEQSNKRTIYQFIHPKGVKKTVKLMH